MAKGFKTGGRAAGTRNSFRKSIQERIEALIAPEPNTGCWLWTGYITEGGYGRFGVAVDGSRQRHGWEIKRAHRVVYELYRGQIPNGLDLDHLCRVRSCVNPDHLEPVTRSANLRRCDRSHLRKSHCKHGHELSETKSGTRLCRVCSAASSRAFRSRNRLPGQEAVSAETV